MRARIPCAFMCNVPSERHIFFLASDFHVFCVKELRLSYRTHDSFIQTIGITHVAIIKAIIYSQCSKCFYSSSTMIIRSQPTTKSIDYVFFLLCRVSGWNICIFLDSVSHMERENIIIKGFKFRENVAELWNLF